MAAKTAKKKVKMTAKAPKALPAIKKGPKIRLKQQKPAAVSSFLRSAFLTHQAMKGNTNVPKQ